MSKFRFAVIAAATLVAPALSHAQVDRTRTWDVYGGFVANRAPNAGNPTYNYGFDGSLTQRIDTRHWVGGMVQGSAVLVKATSASIQSSTAFTPGMTFYTITAGPVFTTRVGGIAPVGHALFGVVDSSINEITVVGQPTTTYRTNHFGSTIGGGLDFPISRGHHAAFRTQADWLRVWQSSAANIDMLKLSAGLLYSFY